MPEAGRASVKFVGDYSSLMAGLTSTLAPGKLKSVGLKAGLAVGGAFAASKVVDEFKKAVDVTMQFDEQISSLGAVAGASEKQMKRLREQAIKLGADTVFSATEAAEAQVELAKGGLGASQILGGALKASLDLAAAGQLDLADAAETTVNAMQLFEMRGRDTSKIADMLATAANKTTADVADFAMSLKMGGSVAKQAGYSLNDTVVILEALAEAGIKNSDAGTSMKTSLIQLLNPTKKQADLAAQLGIEWVKQNGELKNGIEISGLLRRATDDMTKAERTRTFAVLAGTDGFRTLAALYDAGVGKLRSYSRANREQGTAAETARRKTDNLSGDVEELSGAYETLQIRIGTLVTPALRKLTQEGTKAVRWMSDFTAHLRDTPIGDDASWLDHVGNAVELVKGMAQITVDPDGGIKRMVNVFAGSSDEVSRLQATSKARLEAAGSLRRAMRISADARDRAKGATREQRQAEIGLDRARKRHGAGSSQALRAEIRLARAKQRTIRLTNEAKRAEQLEGIERRVTAARTRDQVVVEKSRIGALNRQIRVLGRKREVEIANNGRTAHARELEEKIIEKIKGRERTQRRLNTVLSDAARLVGPKFARSLQQINVRQATLEKVLGRLPGRTSKVRGALGQLPPVFQRVGQTSQLQFGKAETSVGDFAKAVERKRRVVNTNMRLMPEVQIVATDRMIEDFAKKVGAVKDGGRPQSKRRGGLVEWVAQKFGRGGVPVAVSPGEMFKTPDGRSGLVPGRPEPRDSVLTSMPVGTKVFTFDGQRRLLEGASESAALRDQRPHFARGGIVKPEITGGSPKARDLGNTVIGEVHDRATEKLKRLRAAARKMARSSGSWSGGSGTYPGVSGDTDFMPALGHALSAMARSTGTSISVTSGWRSRAEQAALYQAYLNGTGNLAAPPGSSNHESGRAADISPGRGTFGSVAGRFGLGFTVPSEDWHIELLRRGGLVGQLLRLVTGGAVVRQGAPVLHRQGFDHKSMAGIFGNAWQESTWNPAAMEPGTDNGGLFGFTAGEKSLANMRAFAAKRGKSWTDVPTQMQFMLVSGGLGLRDSMNRLDSIPDTTKLFMDEYERPGIPNLERRIEGGFKASKILRGMKLGKGSSGPTAAQKRAAEAKKRKESRVGQIQKLIKKARKASSQQGKKQALWEAVEMYAKYGDFDFFKGKKGTLNEKQDLLSRAGKIAGIANPNRGAGRLFQLADWLERKVDMTGRKDEDKGLVRKLERMRKRGGKVADRRRDRIFGRIARFGENVPRSKWANRNEKQIAILQERIQLAEREHTSDWSDGGSEYTDAEVNTERHLNQWLMTRQNRKYRWLYEAIPLMERMVKSYRAHITKARKSPSERWKLPGLRRGLKGAREALSSNGAGGTGLRQAWVDLVGLTEQGGARGDTFHRLKELGVTGTVEKNAEQGRLESINELLKEQLRLSQRQGAILTAQTPIFELYKNMPMFHQGGVFRAPNGMTEGPALLRDGEIVVTPEQAVRGNVAPVINLTVVAEDGFVDPARIRVEADQAIDVRMSRQARSSSAVKARLR